MTSCADCGEEIIGTYFEYQGKDICEKDYQKYRKKCGTCDEFISGTYYTMDDKLICVKCYKNKIGDMSCAVCKEEVKGEIVRAVGLVYHPQCFICVVCSKDLTADGVSFKADQNKDLHCMECFTKKYAIKCCSCGEPVAPKPGETSVPRLRMFDKDWHPQCFKCQDCGIVLDGKTTKCYPIDDIPLCLECAKKH